MAAKPAAVATVDDCPGPGVVVFRTLIQVDLFLRTLRWQLPLSLALLVNTVVLVVAIVAVATRRAGQFGWLPPGTEACPGAATAWLSTELFSALSFLDPQRQRLATQSGGLFVHLARGPRDPPLGRHGRNPSRGHAGATALPSLAIGAWPRPDERQHGMPLHHTTPQTLPTRTSATEARRAR